MKQYKKRITELHEKSLRFVFGALALYYVIQFVLHLAVKDGVIFQSGISARGYSSSESAETSKYLV